MNKGISAYMLEQLEKELMIYKNNEFHQYHNKKLKIALVTETWPPEINGVALSILQLAKRLQQRGHQFLLIRPQQHQVTNCFVAEQECLVKPQSIPKYKQMQFGWPQVFKLGRAFDEFKPDIVHIVTEGPLGLAALIQAKQRNIPVSSGFHSSFHDFSRYFDLAFLLGPVRHYLKWFHNQTQLTCVPSQDTLQMLKKFGIRCPMHIVGRGVDTQKFNPKYRKAELRQQWQATPKTTVLMNVGRVSPEKDLPCIFEGYQKLKHAQPERDFKLIIVGDGPSLAEYQNKYQATDVIFMGAQTGEMLSQCYASADAFVFASQVETFGNVVLEAMASGLPVLAYDAACAGQMIQHNQHGWLVPLAKVATWQEMLTALPELYQLKKMGKHALLKVEHCSWDQPVADFEKLLITYSNSTIYQ